MVAPHSARVHHDVQLAAVSDHSLTALVAAFPLVNAKLAKRRRIVGYDRNGIRDCPESCAKFVALVANIPAISGAMEPTSHCHIVTQAIQAAAAAAFPRKKKASRRALRFPLRRARPLPRHDTRFAPPRTLGDRFALVAYGLVSAPGVAATSGAGTTHQDSYIHGLHVNGLLRRPNDIVCKPQRTRGFEWNNLLSTLRLPIVYKAPCGERTGRPFTRLQRSSNRANPLVYFAPLGQGRSPAPTPKRDGLSWKSSPPDSTAKSPRSRAC